MKPRRGFTLIEMLGTIALLGAVWATVALALHAMYRAERSLSYGFEAENAVEHLTQRLRSDAHEAGSVTLKESTLSLSFSPTRQVQYRPLNQGVERTVLVSEAIVHHELFYLSTETVLWSIEERDQRQIIRLSLQLRDGRRRLNRDHEIKAAVGLFAAKPTDTEVEQP